MDITFVTSAGTDEQGYMLLKELGMPSSTARRTERACSQLTSKRTTA